MAPDRETLVGGDSKDAALRISEGEANMVKESLAADEAATATRPMQRSRCSSSASSTVPVNWLKQPQTACTLACEVGGVKMSVTAHSRAHRKQR